MTGSHTTIEDSWIDHLAADPRPTLLSSSVEALTFFVRRDLLDEQVAPVKSLWALPEPVKLVRKQQENGSWPVGKKKAASLITNYHLVESFRNLRVMVEVYGFTREHPAIEKAASYVFSCQTAEADIRGILGTQTMPYYHGALLELLIKAGYAEDTRVLKGMEWLLSVRQDDGGWLIPAQTVPPREKTEELWRGDPIPHDRSRPFSHLATGMVLRAFAAHPTYRHNEAAMTAGALLKARFFRPDRYNDRKAPTYWTKFQYPFWWANLLTALDSFSRMGFPADDPDIQKGLDWFIRNQDEQGLWPTGYGKGKRAWETQLWVALAVCRVFKRFFR